MSNDPTPTVGAEDDTELGSDAWLAARSSAGAVYHGESYVIDVVVSGDRTGAGTAYHVVLEDGATPQFRPGPAGANASATLEMSRSEAEGQRRGQLPVVGYMRGSTKTKGATRPIYEFFRVLG